MDAEVGTAAALLIAAVVLGHELHRSAHRRARGGHYDRFVPGGHDDYVTGEEGPERLHLGDRGGWVEPLLPPVPRGGRVIRYVREGPSRWRVTVTDSRRAVAGGRGRTPADAFTRAMEDAGVRGLARGGPLVAGGPPVRVRLVEDGHERRRTRRLRFDGQPASRSPARRASARRA